MKKPNPFCLLLLAITLSCARLAAQTKKGDVILSAGYGVIPSGILLDYIIPGGGSHGIVYTHLTGVLLANARWQLSDNFALGVSYGYREAKGYYFDSDPNYNRNFHYRCEHLTFDGTYSFELDKKASLYTSVSCGASLIHGFDHSKSGSRNYYYRGLGLQLTPIGVRFGGLLSGFAEFGLGYKGLVSGGVSYAVRRKKAAPVDTKTTTTDESK